MVFQAKGVISPLELNILIGSLIYDVPLKKWASENEVDYEIVKKKKQRAIEKIRRYLE